MAACMTCGADWSRGRFEERCPECGGGALTAPCLVCSGRCGALWERAVRDSNDTHLAHFFGSCTLPEDERRGRMLSFNREDGGAGGSLLSR